MTLRAGEPGRKEAVPKLQRLLELMAVPGALPAALRWKKFSLAAYLILTRLREAGVRPATVIDIGANEGQFSVAASHLLPDALLYPVEPDPDTAARLRANLPPAAAERVLVTAVGERSGSVQFQVNADSQVSSVLPLGEGRRQAFPEATVQRTVTLPMDTLDALFRDRPLPGPVLLKVDVQGYEDRVIEGGAALLRGIRWVVLEMSFARLYDGEKDFMAMVELMRRHGFRFVRPLDFHTSGRTGAIIEMDGLFENEALAAR
jgi:FkbM family methyltransferase